MDKQNEELLHSYFGRKPSCIMLVAEESGTLRDMQAGTTNPIKLGPHDLFVMQMRARFNVELEYYIVDCDDYVDLGLSHEYVFDMIVAEYNKYDKTKKLDILFPNIHRI